MKNRIWDGKSPFNNKSSDFIINYRQDIREALENNNAIILISLNGEHVDEIAFENDIRSKYNMDNSLTKEEVAKEYIRIKEEEKQQAETHTNTIEDMGNKISILECENQTLKEELTQIQTSIASLIATTLEEK